MQEKSCFQFCFLKQLTDHLSWFQRIEYLQESGFLKQCVLHIKSDILYLTTERIIFILNHKVEIFLKRVILEYNSIFLLYTFFKSKILYLEDRKQHKGTCKNIFSKYIFNASTIFNIFYWFLILHMSYFHTFIALCPAHPLPPTFPHLSSCPRVVHISASASTFPILFLPSPVYLLPTIYDTYSLYLFPFSPPPTPPLITLHVISISVVLFLF